MYILSAVLEKDRCNVALLNEKYEILSKKSGICSAVNELCSTLLTEKGIKSDEVKYLGVGADYSYGNPCDLASQLEDKIGFKTYGASLISARALGEAYVSSDLPYLTLLKIDDTVECGIVIDKKVYAGVHQLGGRVAHFVIDFDGFECECGRKGCFEAYASVSGLRRIAREAGVEGADTLTHKELFAMNTPEAEKAKKTYIQYIGSGITNVINLFQPNDLVLEGPFTKIGDELMTELMELILREQYTHSLPNKCNIRFAKYDEDIAIIGAALLGR